MWLRRLNGGQTSIERWEYSVPPEVEPSWNSTPNKAMLPLAHLVGSTAKLVHDQTRLSKGDIVVISIAPERRKEAYDWLRDNGFVPTATTHAEEPEPKAAEPTAD
jgi:hypothetical protein